LSETTRQAEARRIVYIAKLFNEEAHLIAGNDVKSIQDLKNREVNIGTEGSGTSFLMRFIFDALHIDVVEVSMWPDEAIEKVKRGQIAATALVAGKPAQSMSRLTPADGLRADTARLGPSSRPQSR